MIETRQHPSLRVAQNKIIPSEHFESDLGLPVRPPGLQLPGRAYFRGTGDRRGLRRNVPGLLEARKRPAKPLELLFRSDRIVPTDMKDVSSPDHLPLAPIRY